MSEKVSLQVLKFQNGSYITVEGKKADSFYIIKEGSVEIRKELSIEESSEVSLLKKGDIFGVVSAMSNKNHIDTAIATSDCVLIGIKASDYLPVIEKNNSIAMKIIHSFSERVHYLDEALTKQNFNNSAQLDSSHLYSVAEYYAKQNQYNQAFYAYSKYIIACPDGEHVEEAKEKSAKIHPYQNAVYVDGSSDEFIRNYPKDTMIFSEGEEGNELFIIQKGTVRITKIVNDNEVQLAMLKTGDIFGEMALLNNQPRSASAIVNEETVMMAVNQGNFQKMVVEQPAMTTKLTTLLSERIWNLYKQLANTLISDPAGRMFDSLMLEMEKSGIVMDDSINKKPHQFSIGPDDLIKMCGLPSHEGKNVIEKVLPEGKLSLVNDKLYTSDIAEIKKSTEYYIKMEKMKRSRENSR